MTLWDETAALRDFDPVAPQRVRSGNRTSPSQCPLYPPKRTNRRHVGMSALCHKRTHPPQHATHGRQALFDLIVGARELGVTVRDCADTQCSWRPLSRPPWARRASVPAGKRQRSFKPFCFYFLADPAAEVREMVANALCEITHQGTNRSAMMSTSIPLLGGEEL